MPGDICTAESWAPVASELARQGYTLTDADCLFLNGLCFDLYAYGTLSYSDREEMRAAKARLRKVAEYAGKLKVAQDQVANHPGQFQDLHWFELASGESYGSGFETWRRANLFMMQRAEVAAQLVPKSRSGGNRSRGDIFDLFLKELLEFWIRCGGKPGKSPKSPAVRFIRAVAKPVIPDLKASTVVHFIRSRGTESRAG
jgi:hypothetical protein